MGLIFPPDPECTCFPGGCETFMGCSSLPSGRTQITEEGRPLTPPADRVMESLLMRITLFRRSFLLSGTMAIISPAKHRILGSGRHAPQCPVLTMAREIFTPDTQAPLLIAPVGQLFTVCGWAKQEILNRAAGGPTKYTYLEQYFRQGSHHRR